MRERNGRKRRTRKEGWRSPRENQRARTGGDENQGTSVPSSSHARNLQLPPTEEDIHTRCSWGPGSIAGKPKSESERASERTLEKRITRLGNAGHEGSRQMRAVGQESKYYDRVVEGAGATLAIPRHPLRSREWSAGGADCPVSSSEISLSTKDMPKYKAPRTIFEYVP